MSIFFFNDTATTEIYTLSLHDALPILFSYAALNSVVDVAMNAQGVTVQRLMGRPVLSDLHAMHSLGGIFGAIAGAMAARLGAAPLPHFVAVAAVAAVA